MPFAKCVVATGGGAVIKRKNWGYMQHGVVIWLDGSPELLASRVVGQSGGSKSRPLIFSNPDPCEEVSLEASQASSYLLVHSQCHCHVAAYDSQVMSSSPLGLLAEQNHFRSAVQNTCCISMCLHLQDIYIACHVKAHPPHRMASAFLTVAIFPG